MPWRILRIRRRWTRDRPNPKREEKTGSGIVPLPYFFEKNRTQNLVSCQFLCFGGRVPDILHFFVSAKKCENILDKGGAKEYKIHDGDNIN